MIDPDDVAPVDLSPLSYEASRRADRIVHRVTARVGQERTTRHLVPSATDVLARWSIPLTLAAAAGIAFLLITQDKSDADAFAAFVIPGQPAAAWVTTGQPPDINEVVAMVGGPR